MGFKKSKSKLDSLQKCLKLNLTLSGITQLLKFTFQQTYPLVRQDREVWCQRWKSSSVHLKWSLPVKASGVSPVKKSKLKFITFAKKNWHPVWSFQNQIMQSVQSPWVHGSEVKKKRSEGVATIEVKTRSSASTFLKFNPEVSWSSRKTKWPNHDKTKPKRSEVYHGYLPEVFKQLRGVLWKIRAYIRVRMKCETIFYTRAIRSQATLPKG